MRTSRFPLLTLVLAAALTPGLAAQPLDKTADEISIDQPPAIAGTDMTGEVLAERIGEHRWVVAFDALHDAATGDGLVDQVIVLTATEPIEVPSFSGLAILRAEESGFVLTVPTLGTTYDVVLEGRPPLTRLPEGAGTVRIGTGLALQYWKPGDAPMGLAEAVRLHGKSPKPMLDAVLQKDPDPHTDSGCGTSCNIRCIDGTSCSIDCNTDETGLCGTCKCDPFAMCDCKGS